MKTSKEIVISDNLINVVKQALQVALFCLVLESFMSGNKDLLDKIDKFLEVEKNEL